MTAPAAPTAYISARLMLTMVAAEEESSLSRRSLIILVAHVAEKPELV